MSHRYDIEFNMLYTPKAAENVDNEQRLLEIMKGINKVAEAYNKRIKCSIHPRTKSRLTKLTSFNLNPLIELHDPFGFFDFVKLEQNAICVLTGSGTVQEECYLFHVPTVTIRKTTERSETIECRSNRLSGINAY